MKPIHSRIRFLLSILNVSAELLGYKTVWKDSNKNIEMEIDEEWKFELKKWDAITYLRLVRPKKTSEVKTYNNTFTSLKVLNEMNTCLRNIGIPKSIIKVFLFISNTYILNEELFEKKHKKTFFVANCDKWNLKKAAIFGQDYTNTKFFINHYINNSKKYENRGGVSIWKNVKIDETIDCETPIPFDIFFHLSCKNPYAIPEFRIIVVPDVWKNIFFPLLPPESPDQELIEEEGVEIINEPIFNVGIQLGSKIVDWLEELGYRNVNGVSVYDKELQEDKFYIKKIYE